MRPRADRWRIDVGDAGVQIGNRLEGAVDVARVERARQAILDAVVDLNRVREILRLQDGKHRPKDFLLLDPHPRLDASGHRRLVEPAAFQTFVSLWNIATERDARPFSLRNVDVFGHLLPRLFVDQWTNFGLGVEPRTEPQLAGAIDEHLHEFVVNLVLQNQPAGGGAALPRRAERPPQHAVEGEIEVGIVHYDHRVLAAHFERQPLEMGGKNAMNVMDDADLDLALDG